MVGDLTLSARRAKSHHVPGDIAPDGRPSPDYVQQDDSIWIQNTLAVVLLTMKDTEVKVFGELLQTV